MTPSSLNQNIKRQLINPSLDMAFCLRIIETLESKSPTEKEHLLETLQESMDIFKQKAKNIKSPELYGKMCESIKTKIQKCDKLFQVTLSDILSLTEGTDICIFDVGGDHVAPKDIEEMIEEQVIGQEEYSKALALCAYLHLLKCRDIDKNIPKMNLLVYGPTGVGKTYSVQVLARKLRIDFQIVNCNTLVQEGIVGNTISDALTHAYLKNKEFKHIIIFFDEFDKLFKKGYYNMRILQELLAYLDDDSEVSFATKFGSSNLTYKKFPTRNIMVILGGVFDTLKEIVFKRVFPQKMGFTGTKERKDIDFYDYVSKKDFSVLFKSEELLGRLGQFVRVKPMMHDTLLDIIKSETASPLIPYANFFEEHGMTVTLTDEGAEQVVNAVQEEKLGVRGLKSVIGAILLEEMSQVKKHDRKAIVIDKEYVTAHLPSNSIPIESA